MDYLKVKKELTKKQENELQKYQYLGAELKNSRLKMAKTLESMINISKSVSYISKVENNKIIPNQACLEELCDELSINKKSLESMSNFEEALTSAIEAIYTNNTELITNLYNKYSIFTNVRTDLMKGLYYLHIENYKELRKVVKNLAKIESNLTMSDYIIYVIISIHDLLQRDEVLSVYRIIQILKESENMTNHIYLIIKKIEFNIKKNFMVCSYENDYKELFSEYMKVANNSDAYELNKIYIESRIELCEKRVLLKLYNTIQDAKLKFYIALYLKDEDLIENNKPESIDLKYQIKYYYIKEDSNSLLKLIECKNLSKELLVLANFYKLKIENNLDILREYIINICIPFYKQRCMINCLLEVYNELVVINSQHSRYKETTIIGSEIINLIKEITSITT